MTSLRPRIAALAAALLGASLLAATTVTALAEGWSYTGGDGSTVTLDEMPVRIIASQDAAAGLIPLGIRPVGIYANSPIADAKALQGLDLSGIEIIGEVWGDVNREKALALEPDLVIGEWWPRQTTWSGGPNAVAAFDQVAPITGPIQGNSILALIEDYEKLAESLGADLSQPEIASGKAAFSASLEAFKSAVAAKPGLTVLAVTGGPDALNIADVTSSAELQDFVSWGLNLISAENSNGYWEELSWEVATKYQPDLILVDDRAKAMQLLPEQPMWTRIKAAEAGQVTRWPAFWLRNYAAYARELDALTQAVDAADPDLVP
jgi:iron complex transport system substrate-binding protein